MTAPLPKHLIDSHRGTIYKQAYLWARRWKMLNHFEDMAQEGMLALLYAWKKYDKNRKVRGKPVKFNTYLYWWLQAYLAQYVALNMSIVGKQRNKFWKEAKVRDFELDELMFRDNEEKTFMDTLEDEVTGVEDRVVRDDLKRKVREAISPAAKTELQRYVLENRLLSDAPMTLEGVGKVFGCTYENVRGVEKRLMRRVRNRVKGELRELRGMV